MWDLLSELGYAIFTATGRRPYAREDLAEAGDVVNWLATPHAR
ncbi:MAG TPA: hypothetical protein VLZ06_10655 [Solirubrobacteraceae bacterium]|nr:hypothetical protein [Solirubrobacteraceae bacterium]